MPQLPRLSLDRGTKVPPTLPDHHLRRPARPRRSSAVAGADSCACREINSLRGSGQIIAIDLPSGLDGDSGEADTECVAADFTITVGFAKRGLVADSAIDFVGRLEVVALEELQPDASGGPELATPESLRALLPRRKYSAYKNQFGRIGIVAGSRGFTGAAIMCSFGALRAGAGLVELFVPEEIYEIVASAAAPEVMVKPVQSYADLLAEPIDVWAVGPGLGKSHAEQILELIRKATQPMVVDADGLNILAENMTALKNVQGPRLLTPHPGEMKRLFPDEKCRARRRRRRFPQNMRSHSF